MSDSIARRVFYSGRVQGVGFRWNTAHLARGFQVAGHVRNLPDGRVELLAEGAAGEVERFLAAVEERFEGHIRERRQEAENFTGQCKGFQISY